MSHLGNGSSQFHQPVGLAQLFLQSLDTCLFLRLLMEVPNDTDRSEELPLAIVETSCSEFDFPDACRCHSPGLGRQLELKVPSGSDARATFIEPPFGYPCRIRVDELRIVTPDQFLGAVSKLSGKVGTDVHEPSFRVQLIDHIRHGLNQTDVTLVGQIQPRAQLSLFEDLPRDDHQLCQESRRFLKQVIICARAHRLDGCRGIGLLGLHDDRGVRGPLPEFRENVQPAAGRQLLVQQNDVPILFRCPLQRFLCRIDRFHPTTGIEPSHADRDQLDLLGLLVHKQQGDRVGLRHQILITVGMFRSRWHAGWRASLAIIEEDGLECQPTRRIHK